MGQALGIAFAQGRTEDSADIRTERSALRAPERSVDQPLTAREREVATLVMEGFTDKEIAARLFIAPRPTEGHVQRTRVKLGLASPRECNSRHGLLAGNAAAKLTAQTRDTSSR